jgi:eukaryotic-like serine/threonine-protein kinase
MIGVKKNEHDRMLLARITLVTAMSLLGSLAVVGIAYAQQQQQGEEWPQYQNATYGVRMLYPSNWTQQNSIEPGDDRFILVSEFFSSEDANGYFADVKIAIDSMPQTTSIESYRSQSVDIYRQDSNFEDLQLLSSSVGNFALAAGAAAGTENATESIPAYAFEITYTDPEFGPQNMLEVGTIFDNRVYYIQYFADPPIYQKYLPIVERMIESFQIVQ